MSAVEKNPPILEIKINLTEPSYVVNWSFNSSGDKGAGTYEVFVYEGRADNVILGAGIYEVHELSFSTNLLQHIEEEKVAYNLPPDSGGTYLALVMYGSICYYSMHTWHRTTNKWDHFLVRSVPTTSLSLVSSGVNNTPTCDLAQDDSPLEVFNNSPERYDVIWDPNEWDQKKESKSTFVIRMHGGEKNDS